MPEAALAQIWEGEKGAKSDLQVPPNQGRSLPLRSTFSHQMSIEQDQARFASQSPSFHMHMTDRSSLCCFDAPQFVCTKTFSLSPMPQCHNSHSMSLLWHQCNWEQFKQHAAYVSEGTLCLFTCRNVPVFFFQRHSFINMVSFIVFSIFLVSQRSCLTFVFSLGRFEHWQ